MGLRGLARTRPFRFAAVISDFQVIHPVPALAQTPRSLARRRGYDGALASSADAMIDPSTWA